MLLFSKKRKIHFAFGFMNAFNYFKKMSLFNSVKLLTFDKVIADEFRRRVLRRNTVRALMSHNLSLILKS